MTYWPHPRSHCAWLALGLLYASHPAEAQDEFRAAFREAVAAKERAQETHRAKDWQEALQHLQIADALRKTPEVGYEIGVAASNLGYDDLAVEAYQRSLALGLKGPVHFKARDYVSEHRSEMATLNVTGQSGCQLLVNDVERASLPQPHPILVHQGKIRLELRCDGKQTQARQLPIVAGQLLELHLDEPESVSVAPSLATNASLNILQPTKQATAAAVGVVIREPPWPNRSASPSHESTKHGGHTLGYALLGGGTTLALLSAGLISLSKLRAASSEQRLFDLCAVQVDGRDSCRHSKPGVQTEAQAASDSIATWKTANTAGWIGLASGLSAAASGVVALLTTPSKRREAPPRIGLSLEPRGMALTWRNEF